MLSESDQDLIKEQITKSYSEMLFQKAVFALMNSVSLSITGFILYKIFVDFDKTSDDYAKLIQGAVTLFVPYLSFAAQGFSFPRRRKVSVLRYLLFKDDLSDTDYKSIYEK